MAKYEASRADAHPAVDRNGQGAAEGTSDRVKSASLCPVRSGVDWDEAVRLARGVAPEADLMGDEDWTALAVWSAIHGVSVRGNNSAGTWRDVEDPGVQFVPDPRPGKLSLAGSGHDPAWGKGIDLTTHTGMEAGVSDLNGNLEEWTYDLEVVGGPGQVGTYAVRGVDTGIRVPVGGGGATAIRSLSTAPALRRLGVPATVGVDGLPAFGLDHAVHDGATGVRIMRGGGFYDVERAGIWHMHLTRRHDFSHVYFGFRPVLRYR
ncbi:MAG: hypothetical protein VKO21_04060 [Candidatus Sericytochromatia bacterium]|nr:hypothetical protein [Candidatus Sericytochromatia bacterium]